MRKMKWLVVLMICLISVVSSISVCFAGERSTTVSYNPIFEELAPTNVKIIISAKMSKFGSIYDGDKKLGVGETVYQLRHTEKKTLRIQPNFGYDVEKVIYDKEDITNELRSARSILKNYLIEIEGKGHDAQLDVEFKSLSTGEPDEPLDPDNPDNPADPDNPAGPNGPDGPNTPNIDQGQPTTGDAGQLIGYLAIVIVTLVVFITTLLSRRKTDE